jgi:hypothetical protein
MDCLSDTLEGLFAPILSFFDNEKEHKDALAFYAKLESGERAAFFKVLCSADPADRKTIYVRFRDSFKSVDK